MIAGGDIEGKMEETKMSCEILKARVIDMLDICLRLAIAFASLIVNVTGNVIAVKLKCGDTKWCRHGKLLLCFVLHRHIRRDDSTSLSLCIYELSNSNQHL
jgi:hypothetical protein